MLPPLSKGQIWLVRSQSIRVKIGDWLSGERKFEVYDWEPNQAEPYWSSAPTAKYDATPENNECYTDHADSANDLVTLLYDPGNTCPPSPG